MKRFLRSVRPRGIFFDGWYTVWSDAYAQCSGYDQENIAQQALSASLLVSQGKAVFERDSVLFDQIHYSWPLLSGLMFAAAMDDGVLKVIDFGGAFGTSYFQNQKFLKHLKNIEWSVIEQSNFVALGRQHLQNSILKFYHSTQELSVKRQANVVLLSSVMQYLPNPYAVLGELLQQNPKVVIFDRTSFIISGGEDRIRIQHVPKEIYKASYPCWFLSKSKLLLYLEGQGYKLLEMFDSDENLDKFATWGGMIFIRESND